MAFEQTLRGVRLRIEEAKSPGEKPEAVFSLANTSGESWSLARIVGIGDGEFGGRLAFETNAGGEEPTDETVERVTIDNTGHVEVPGSLTVGGALKAGAIADVAAEITGHKHTAKEVGALPIGGGKIDGSLTVTDKLDVKGTLDATDIRMKGKPLALSPWSNATGGINYKGGRVGIGTDQPSAKLQIVNRSQDAGGDTLILGPIDGSNLRMGYHAGYGWIQSHRPRPLAINPIGNNVGIGTSAPEEILDVDGNLRVRGTIIADAMRFPLFTAEGTKSITLASTNKFAAVPDLTLRLKFQKETSILIYYQVSYGGGKKFLVLRLMVDRKRQTQSQTIMGETLYKSPSNLYMTTMSKGTHTIQVQYRTPDGGINNPGGKNYQNRTLRVLAFGAGVEKA